MTDPSDIPQPINDVLPHEQSDSSRQAVDELQRIRHIYLELMQSSLTGNIYRDESRAPFGSNTFNPQLREHGLDWPSHAQTMIGIKRLANLRALTESVIADNVPGDLIETGVWRGGACILMRAVLWAHNISDRCVWVADSFEGLPPADESRYPADAGSSFHKYEELVVSIEQVQENFRAYDLLDEQVKFIKGWFKDTLPNAPIGQLALLRLDGDMYESTMDALTNLYPKLSPNGYAIIDDYHVVPACKAAVNDYCAANGLQPEIKEIDGVGVYWRKSGEREPVEHPAEIMRANGLMDSRDVQTARLNWAVIELSQNVISGLNQSLAERDAQIIRLNQSVKERDVQIARLNRASVERDKLVVALNQSIAKQDIQITQLNQSIAELTGKVAALLSSTSWQITKPIRGAKNIINAIRLNYPPIAALRDSDQSRSKTDHHPSAPEVRLIDAASVRNCDPILSIQEKSKTKEPIYKSPSKFPFVERVSPTLIWEDDLHLKISDVSFHLSCDTGELQRGNSTADNFLLGKPRHMVEKSVEIGQRQKISKIFEMGILKGGSVVLYDQIFQPLKITAIDHMPEPVGALTKYIAKHSKSSVIKPYYGINQADRLNMEKILSFEFPDRDIDLIIDDASHMYEETREAFNISFPYVTPGGFYIIEDWAWAHWAGDPWQSKNSSFSCKTALSNLLIELFMLTASRPDFIEEIFINHNSIIIKKGYAELPADNFDIADHYLLRGKKFGAWL